MIWWYRFGKTEIFNPWTVINYFNNECEARVFWQSTGSNDIIGEILSEANKEISLVYHKEILQKLDNIIPEYSAISIQEAIFSGNNEKLKMAIQTLLAQSVSSFDTVGENFLSWLDLC